jgi:NADH:ubiquinone oxidoreductase subunit 6 (subunit J)
VSLEALGFWLVAVVLLAASLAVVLTPNLFHAVLYLAAALVATAGVFLILGAEFLAWIQLLLYAGGVVTLLVFAIMLTERLVAARITQSSRWLVNGAMVAGAFLAGVGGFLVRGVVAPPRPPVAGDVTAGMVSAVIGPFALPFHLLAVLLVAALLGALYFARTEE